MLMTGSENTRCGYVAIIGRPNVGKSTLLNRIMGEKISITSRKPQTTRHKILGIQTRDDCQIVYVDTPGLHFGFKRAINRVMNKAAKDALKDVDLILCLVDGVHWKSDDDYVLEQLSKTKTPVILVINKVDTLDDKNKLLPTIEHLKKKYSFKTIVPISAKLGTNVPSLEAEINQRIPSGPHLFYPDQVTDKSNEFIISELIREKIFRLIGQELPYSITVQIEQFKKEGKLFRISALIYVEKDSQKKILIGTKGEKLKSIGQKARHDIEKLLGKKVFLQLWVKVKSGWSDDERSLRTLGYTE